MFSLIKQRNFIFFALGRHEPDDLERFCRPFENLRFGTQASHFNYLKQNEIFSHALPVHLTFRCNRCTRRSILRPHDGFEFFRLEEEKTITSGSIGCLFSPLLFFLSSHFETNKFTCIRLSSSKNRVHQGQFHRQRRCITQVDHVAISSSLTSGMLHLVHCVENKHELTCIRLTSSTTLGDDEVHHSTVSSQYAT